MPSGFEIVTVPQTGVKSLRCLERKETFHPGIGPLEEATILHVNQGELAALAARPGRVVVWDVGLGAAANAIAAWNALPDPVAEVEIHSFDISTAPLEFALRERAALTYVEPYAAALAELLAHGRVELGPRRRWFFHAGDFRNVMHDPALPRPQRIFYDPYSPATNQEMWTLDHFTSLRARLGDEPALLTNYTRSTAVRVTLLLAGFSVGLGASIGEKDQTTIAATVPGELRRPLGRDWLERVKVSGNAAPMRELTYTLRPIAAADLAALRDHPQFR